MSHNSSLIFHVHRHEPVLVAPAQQTPLEFKRLSDIDDQEGLRFHMPVFQFYHYNPSMEGMDPAKVIRDALAKALVPYYPFAGRLRELQDGSRKLVVECTGEGALFIEAHADVSLEQFGNLLQQPFPCIEELLFNVPGSSKLLDTPLVLIQVTRLQCGGFIFAMRYNHVMSDAQGLVQFMTAIAEMARGQLAPSISPVWLREILEARSPPRPSFAHREYDVEVPKAAEIPLDDHEILTHHSFLFGSREIDALRKHTPHHLRNKVSTIDLLTACLWKCRTVALSPHPNEKMRMVCIVNARIKKRGFNLLPEGYYGNAIAYAMAISTAGKLCKNPLGYAMDLVRKAKLEVNNEYMRSVADLMVLRDRPLFAVTRTYLVSDVTRARFGDVDFGWGKASYGGPAVGWVGPTPGLGTFYIPSTNEKGENVIVVPVLLSRLAMEKFMVELEALLKPPIVVPVLHSTL